MESVSIQHHIKNWLSENHAPGAQRDIMLKVMTVGKPSHCWAAAIQRYIKEKNLQSPSRGDIKKACRALLEEDFSQ